MGTHRTSKHPTYLTKLRRAVALLEPTLDIETVFSMTREQVATVLLHHALQMDAQRLNKKERSDEEVL